MSESQRSTIRRDKLIARLSTVVAKIPTLQLPASITAVYVFGGLLRDKERLHDIDALFLYSQTNEQREQWVRFMKNFKINMLWLLLEPYWRQKTTLADAVLDDKLSRSLQDQGVEPLWVGCFAWNDMLHPPLGIFLPFLEIALRRQLLKGNRGLEAALERHDLFEKKESGYSHLNTVLAWSPEKPDIEKNLQGRSSTEKRKLILDELAKFRGLISDSESEYQLMKTRLSQGPIKLSFDVLEARHRVISSRRRDSYAELVETCERARCEMRMYDEELSLLRNLLSQIEFVSEQGEDRFVMNPAEEYVAWLALEHHPKNQVKEERARELLKSLGLPEEKVLTIRAKGSKASYDLANVKYRMVANEKGWGPRTEMR